MIKTLCSFSMNARACACITLFRMRAETEFRRIHRKKPSNRKRNERERQRDKDGLGYVCSAMRYVSTLEYAEIKTRVGKNGETKGTKRKIVAYRGQEMELLSLSLEEKHLSVEQSTRRDAANAEEYTRGRTARVK